MRLRIDHATRYAFSRPVQHGLQRLRLTPKVTNGQQVIDWTMDLTGARLEVEYDDHNHNRTSLISVEPGVSAVEVRCSGTIVTANNHGVIGHHAGHMPLWSFLAQTALTRPGPGVKAIVAQVDAPRSDIVAQLHQLSALVIAAVRYVPGTTTVETSAEQSVGLGLGVCQDHAHIFICGARSLGIPARYVSGYLMLTDRVDQDAGHAWAEAHVDGLGWVGFDVSNGISPDERYVRVATGRDYREAAPVIGLSYGAGETQLEVRLAVEQQTNEQ